ncbi:hypothetical protein CBLAS_0879 [Campylobacter blaseri]|uniref:Polyhydroxyalkanoate synthesis regulator n=1 Tax=Campylobacter blaseri TaxID=2042961 RepID=A0A2P8R2M9_9BACT|nr:hypothetical protein [Campylobacter blaseri]PSM52755.1 hypothetical protein CQ405_03250 [Campylobacter blaseri]PSM54403.1 hypothetical protein CRN67_03250 [Campylobacter blaseri]QKF86064.1 hypothetical protein CBLAS_0879 [Campylobacter blaseri]
MFKDLFYIGLGGFLEAKERIEKELKALEEKGKISKEDSKDFLKNLYNKGEEEHSKHCDAKKKFIKELIEEFNIATKDDIKALEEKIEKKFL